MGLIGLISIYIQILLGVLLYILSPLGISNFSGESMRHKISRFYIIEHPLGMIISAILITLGYISIKNHHLSDQVKYKRVLIFYSLGLGITVYLIPWFLWS